MLVIFAFTSFAPIIKLQLSSDICIVSLTVLINFPLKYSLNLVS